MPSHLRINTVPRMNLWTIFAITIFLQNVLIVAAKQNQLIFKMQLQGKHPYIQGQTLTYQSLVKHEPSSNETARNVSVAWVLPSHISYQSYESLSSANKTPVDVTSATLSHISYKSQKSLSRAKTPSDAATNVNKITMKIGSLSPLQEINILITIKVDPDHTLRDNVFRHTTISTTLKYRWSDLCSKDQSFSRALHFPFFCPECTNFGSLNGNIKDSQIQASTAQTFRSSDTEWEWEPMTSFDHLNVKRKMKFNFLQIDLKSSRQVDMVYVDGVPARDPIPWNIIQLSYSDNTWKWKAMKNLQVSKVFQGEDTVAVAITTVKPIKTRFIRINVPPYGLLDKATYKMQLFGCNHSEILSEDPSPVGIESSSLVPDSRFSSPSILGPQYQPHFGRLNTEVGGGSWCASGCSPLQYLQIDLGDTWKISEIIIQGRNLTNGNVFSVKTFSLSSSLDGTSWVPHRINGGTKIFWVNDIANLATKHKLFQPLTIQYVRFEPRTCTQSIACMRVELYGTKTSVANRKVLPGVVFGRSMLLKPAENIAFVCNTEVSEDNAHCFSSKDKGRTWKAIPVQVLSVLGFDSNEQRLYGLTRNGKNILKSKDPGGSQWYGIPQQDWLSVRDGGLVYTAVEIPFVPISRNETNVIEPLVQLTAFNGGKWQADQVGVYYKPAGGASKMVLSFLPYSQDLSPNPCHTGVCSHGRCEHVGSQFKCHCSAGYTGRFCDTETNYCLSNPCQNGGTCSSRFMSFTCACQTGYYGARCQDYDECVSSPCLNGGTCIEGHNNFTCICAQNYRGKTCQDFDDCARSPCQNGGTCTDGASSYTCSCPKGYSGPNCLVTPCSPRPCLNGGTCHLNGGSYLCTCTIEYSGLRCANGNFLTSRGIFSPRKSDVWSTSSGKYDKIVFYSDANLTVFAVCLSDTFASSKVPCPYESRIRKEGSSTILASRTGIANCQMDNKYVNCPPFANPYKMIAGTRYIIEVRMTSSKANIRKIVNGLSSRTINLPDGSLSVTYNYETVDAAELADSNGSTQSEGGIFGLSAQIAHD